MATDTIEQLRCVIEDLTRQVREARAERDAWRNTSASLTAFRSSVRALWFGVLKNIAENETYIQLPGAVGCDSLRSQNMAARAIAERLHVLLDATAPETT